MSNIETIEVPVVKPKVKTQKEVREKILSEVSEESQVIVHCTFYGYGSLIRIWQSTFLFSHESSHVSKLVHHENITLYPNWMEVSPTGTTKFTLVFTALPKSCKKFDLIEKIPQSGGFECRNINRNKTDIYKVEIS